MFFKRYFQTLNVSLSNALKKVFSIGPKFQAKTSSRSGIKEKTNHHSTRHR